MSMDTVFQELTLGSQREFSKIRRKVQFFSTFAGGVIEALRESGYRLSNIEKEFPFRRFGQQAGGLQAQSQNITAASGGNNLELYFEQQDQDQCRVLVIPYRTDLPFLSSGHYVAQLGLELSRYSSDPDVLRQAMNVNSRARMGSYFGQARLPKLYLDSPPDLRQPGSMAFELQGARLVVSMNILTDLSKYRISDFDLDIEAIKSDFEAYFYGLEKYLSLLLQNFGSDVRVEEEPTVVETQQPVADSTASVAPVAPSEETVTTAPAEVAPSPPPSQPAPPAAPTPPEVPAEAAPKTSPFAAPAFTPPSPSTSQTVNLDNFEIDPDAGQTISLSAEMLQQRLAPQTPGKTEPLPTQHLSAQEDDAATEPSSGSNTVRLSDAILADIDEEDLS